VAAWRSYVAGISDAADFLSVFEWVGAVVDSGVHSVWGEIPIDIKARTQDLPPAAKVYSTPADYGVDAWSELPLGYSKERVNVPSASDIVALYEIVHSERKRKEIDGLFQLDDHEMRVDSVDEVRVVRHDAETGTLTLDLPIVKLTALPYRDSVGNEVFEAKRPEDFTTPRFLGGIPGKPITQLHPTKHFHQIPDAPHLPAMAPDEANARTYGVHHKGQDSVWVVNDRIWSRVTLFEPRLVQDVLLGNSREVSTGIVARVVDWLIIGFA
jgi:hypothetical protein